MATLFGLVVIYGMFPYVDEKEVPVINPFVRVSYGVLHHSVWAIAVGWVIFACTHGYGGMLRIHYFVLETCVTHFNLGVRFHQSFSIVETVSSA